MYSAADCLGRILDNDQVVPPRHREWGPSRPLTEEVDRNDGSGLGSDPFLDQRRVDVVGPRIDIHKDRRGPHAAIQPAVAKNVYGVVITSSPGPISSAIRQANRASLPEDTPTPWAHWQ